MREKGGKAEWTSSRLKASKECSIGREAGSASSGHTEDEEAVELVVGMLVEGELQVESRGERFTCGGGDQEIDGERLQLTLGIFPEVTEVRWFERR